MKNPGYFASFAAGVLVTAFALVVFIPSVQATVNTQASILDGKTKQISVTPFNTPKVERVFFVGASDRMKQAILNTGNFYFCHKVVETTSPSEANWVFNESAVSCPLNWGVEGGCAEAGGKNFFLKEDPVVDPYSLAVHEVGHLLGLSVHEFEGTGGFSVYDSRYLQEYTQKWC